MIDDHVLRNREAWDADADNWVQRGRDSWMADEITWGIWSGPEFELHLLPDVDGLDVVELGCGTGYLSAWLARRGAQLIGLDNSGRQLATARSFQDQFDLSFPLIHADAERPPLRDGSFDLAVSEYGAAIWCDPHAWTPEAARILRPGGGLCSSATPTCRCSRFPMSGRRPSSSGARTSGCTGSSGGRTRGASSSSARTAG
ncbi:MAG: class I SAM-dependent methyltransferase [Actinomycetota bacterium]